MTTVLETESTWLTSTEPRRMLTLLKGKSRERKFKLFACACCRRISHLLKDERSREAIEVIEKFHDGLVTRQTYDLAERAANAVHTELEREVAAEESDPDQSLPRSILLLARLFAAQAVAVCFKSGYFDVAQGCCGALRGNGTAHVPEKEAHDAGERIGAAEQAIQADLLRDIFENPFRPTALDPSWLTSTVIALARQIYESRESSALPILADALQDAGCNNEDILNHCRQQGVHVRGCWVVDRLLAKD